MGALSMPRVQVQSATRADAIAPTVPLLTAGLRQRVADYVALAKPRVVLMVLVTTVVGSHLGSTDPQLGRLLHALVGTALAAGGTLALNQYMERDLDTRMERTRHRPLPDGRLQPVEGLVFGLVLLLGGLAYLAAAANGLAALI